MGLNCSQMHLDTTHKATYTLESLLLKISTRNTTFEPFFQNLSYIFSVRKHFAAFCRFGAISGKMQVAPPPLSFSRSQLIIFISA